jgi:hypothetical protein
MDSSGNVSRGDCHPVIPLTVALRLRDVGLAKLVVMTTAPVVMETVVVLVTVIVS